MIFLATFDKITVLRSAKYLNSFTQVIIIHMKIVFPGYCFYKGCNQLKIVEHFHQVSFLIKPVQKVTFLEIWLLTPAEMRWK